MTATSRKRRAFPFAPLAMAGLAVLILVALLSGQATLAAWTDTSNQDVQSVSSQTGLSLAMSSSSAAYELDQTTRPTSTKATSTGGLVPGIRGVRITYTMTTGATDGVQGKIAGTITAAARTAWPAIYSAGYLTAVVSSSGGCVVQPTPAMVANALTWTFATPSGQTLKPGESCSVVLDLSVPAVKGAVDVSRALKTSRGSDATPNPLADFVADAVVTQVARADEK
ncbi:SipW-dependent-type signal peptide-containing protein [Mycetocola zhujimingii]|uniref:Uncharacterized protein n=1 Tax=Mycetocola zhujimingii TaxID=2079792 RepID=A0A2U1TB90_9MICO|nr:SipW-dependent-type signal peptide-containing protein [Mycetocola zhujimingii]PWC06162.1 hypothetical protein DF223_11080 [Mycetocola zhujimingii]